MFLAKSAESGAIITPMMRLLTHAMIKNPEKVCFIGEDHDETILYVLRRSVVTNVGWFFGSIGLFLAPILIDWILLAMAIDKKAFVPAEFAFVLTIFWYIFAIGFVFERFLNWFFNVYIISNKRIIDMDFHHMLSRDISEAPLRNVEDITHSVKGFMQLVFNFGDIMIQTAAEQREFNFEKVPNPAKVQDILSDLVSEIKHHD